MQNDKAVSPIVGVILMVAITVILAAVIAAIVFGYAGANIHMKQVSATAIKGPDGMITVTYHGGQDQNMVTLLTVIVNGKEAGTMTPTGNRVEPGKSAGFQGTSGTDNVIVKATHDDGTNQVILDTNV